jgi:hypothetical protein
MQSARPRQPANPAQLPSRPGNNPDYRYRGRKPLHVIWIRGHDHPAPVHRRNGYGVSVRQVGRARRCPVQNGAHPACEVEIGGNNSYRRSRSAGSGTSCERCLDGSCAGHASAALCAHDGWHEDVAAPLPGLGEKHAQPLRRRAVSQCVKPVRIEDERRAAHPVARRAGPSTSSNAAAASVLAAAETGPASASQSSRSWRSVASRPSRSTWLASAAFTIPDSFSSPNARARSGCGGTGPGD